MTTPDTTAHRQVAYSSRSFWGGLLVGVAVMAGIDEIVFHQVLAWHHFYDLGTSAVALVSDGLLHAAGLLAIVAGFVLLLDAHRRGRAWSAAAWAGVFVGLGAFQLWDGTVHHKVLGLHQVRYGVDLVPYDVAWIASGVLLLCVGLGLLVRLVRR